MSMDKENFYIEGSGRAVILNDSGSLDLIHLQNMSLELSSTMEQIYGGESNFSLYSYQTDRGARVTFTNASMNINILNMVQGTQLDPKVVLFAEEKLTVTSEGKVNFQKVPGTNDQIDWNTVVASKVSDGTRVEITRDATKSSTVVTAETLEDAIIQYENALLKSGVIEDNQLNVEVAEETEITAESDETKTDIQETFEEMKESDTVEAEEIQETDETEKRSNRSCLYYFIQVPC